MIMELFIYITGFVVFYYIIRYMVTDKGTDYAEWTWWHVLISLIVSLLSWLGIIIALLMVGVAWLIGWIDDNNIRPPKWM